MKFHHYTRESGWNYAAQINCLVESLNPDFQQTLITITLFNNLKDYINLINYYYNNLLHLNIKSSNPTLIKMIPTFKISIKDLNVMNINSYLFKYTLKNFAER